MKVGDSLDINLEEMFYQALTPQILSSLVVVLVLSVLSVIIGMKVKAADPYKSPKGIVLFAEIYVTMINNMVENVMGLKNKKFAPYFATLIPFLFLGSIIGLFGLTSATASINVTGPLALITFALIQIYAFKAHGFVGYVNRFVKFPFSFKKVYGVVLNILLLPLILVFSLLNVLSEVSTPISMMFRIFGNILAGVIVMLLIYSVFGALGDMFGWNFNTGFFAVVVTPFFHVYFDLFAALIQTIVFSMLSMIFIALAQED